MFAGPNILTISKSIIRSRGLIAVWASHSYERANFNEHLHLSKQSSEQVAELESIHMMTKMKQRHERRNKQLCTQQYKTIVEAVIFKKHEQLYK